MHIVDIDVPPFENTVDSDQLASDEANWSISTD